MEICPAVIQQLKSHSCKSSRDHEHKNRMNKSGYTQAMGKHWHHEYIWFLSRIFYDVTNTLNLNNSSSLWIWHSCSCNHQPTCPSWLSAIPYTGVYHVQDHYAVLRWSCCRHFVIRCIDSYYSTGRFTLNECGLIQTTNQVNHGLAILALFRFWRLKSMV